MLRRRLTLAFVLVAGVAAGALAAGAYVLVRDARRSDSLDRAAAALRVDLRQASAFGPPLSRADVAGILAAEEGRGQPAIVVDGERVLASGDAVAPMLPRRLRERVGSGQIAYERVGGSRLLVGARIPGATQELYLVVSEGALARDLRVLGRVLAIGWLAVVVGAALVGRALATRTLTPVARGALAARAIAGGSLSTRLPVERDDEFGAWAAAFNEMAAALEAQIAELTAAREREQRFTADVAHELRTPLTAMVAASAMLKERLDAIPAAERRPVELLAGDVERLQRLVEDLTEISRLDAGRADVRIEPLDLAELVRATSRARGWSDRVAVAGGPLELRSDRRRVERIVANLVDNALVHGGGAARVALRREGETAVIEVRDAGPGIGAEHRPHVFDRFYKADAARAEPGSGLGLAIARENARLLGGDVVLDAGEGAGSRFEVRLPVTRSLPEGRAGVAGEAQTPAS